MSRREGSEAKKPYVLGSLFRRVAENSLHSRARRAAFWGSVSMHAPGAVIESIEILTPTSAERALSASNVHGGIYQPEGSPPWSSRAVVYLCEQTLL